MSFAGVGQATATVVDGVVGVPVAGIAALLAKWWWDTSMTCLIDCTLEDYPQILGFPLVSDEGTMVLAALIAGGLAALVTHLTIRSQP